MVEVDAAIGFDLDRPPSDLSPFACSNDRAEKTFDAVPEVKVVGRALERRLYRRRNLLKGKTRIIHVFRRDPRINEAHLALRHMKRYCKAREDSI